MKNLSSLLKSLIKNNIHVLTKLFGITLLNKKQTEIYLQSKAETLFREAGNKLILPEVVSLAADQKKLFKESHIATATAYIWKYQNTAAQARQLRNGSIVVGNKALDMGFGNGIIAKDLLKNVSRSARTTKILIAPWCHYWTGYFDYIFFVALSICRIKELLSAEEFADAIVCYPLANLAFEQQLVDLLGIKKENLVDSRETTITFETCYIGNNDSWFYPNRENVLLFKNTIENKIVFKESKASRIYIQRTGRRKILNEDDLLLLLAQFDIEIIADTSRSFVEQVNIYRNATFIIGPHGASFANILWCQPGTQLVELFSNHYMPEYFRYLSQVLGLEYNAYCQGQPMGNDHSHVNDDILVNLTEIEQYLRALLK